MLARLNVKNYALIADVAMDFNKGMNIITGETGAGKSILVGALGLAIGRRADTSVLRNSQSKCIVEAEFEIQAYGLETEFEKYDLDYSSQTTLRREINPAGKSRSFINDTPVNLNLLQLLGAKLIEVHSQRDNVMLFTSAFQYTSLDIMSKVRKTTQEYMRKLAAFKHHQHVLKELRTEEESYQKESDYFQFLADELRAVGLESIDEELLNEELEILSNAEELIDTYKEASQLINTNEHSIIHQLRNVQHILQKNNIAISNELSARVASVLIELQDVGQEIEQNASRIEVDPKRLNELNEKTNSLYLLKNKHRVSTLSELRELLKSLDEKLINSGEIGEQIATLQDQLDKEEQMLNALAKQISEKRHNHVSHIETQVNNLLAQMGMQHSRAKYELTQCEGLNSFGCDNLQVLLSSDKGQTYKPIKKAASGGELARINLSFKQILSDSIQMPCSVFDEIDTGVSGEIARKVGGVMKTMASHQQVIVITHLPQIASLGNHHMYVYKSEVEGSVQTQVKMLSGDDRVHEIAKMISGDNLTDHAIEQSKSLLS